MKNSIVFFFLLLAGTIISAAQCPAGQSQVIVVIQPDAFPQETSWTLHDGNGNLLAEGDSLGDTLCVPTGACLTFRIQDSYGDGICCNFGNGFYAVYLNGVIQAAGGQFTFSETTYINCPPGTFCGSALPAVEDSLYTAIGKSTWYAFTPDTTGNYNISTCFPTNTCDTRIWVYDHCTGLVWNDNMAGTLFYNDSACGIQAFIAAGLQAGSTYYVRIGGDTTCVDSSITWNISYAGPIVGCTDSTACNFNPLATVSNGNCIYPGDPNCANGPDLFVDYPTLVSSLSIGSVNGNDVCLIGEGCLSGYGQRQTINFSTYIGNSGDQDYYIGSPTTGGNQFVFDQCHGHWHYAGYAMYNIYDSTGTPLQAGFKNGFCVMDLTCFGGTAKYGCSNMGISAGCADIYGAGLSCQWLDITMVPAGRYTLVVRVNWDESPDKLGRIEKAYGNNVAAVCLNITRNAQNQPAFTILGNCPPLVDCAGDTFGLAVYDCMGNCNGTRVSGDLDIDNDRDLADIGIYMNDIAAQNTVMACNDVNGDGTLTVTDAALVSGCIRSTNGTHGHGGTQLTHRHCEFPFNIVNTNDTVRLGLGSVNTTQQYVDILVQNRDNDLLALDFTLSGLVIDSVASLSPGFNPMFTWDAATGRIAMLDTMEQSFPRQLVTVSLLRVYYSSLSSNTICIASVNASVNDDYEETLKGIFNGCVTVTGINILYRSGLVQVVPNPSNGLFTLQTGVLDGQEATIEVTDALGKLVLAKRVTMNAGQGITLDLSDRPKGVYLLRVQTAELMATERMVKL